MDKEINKILENELRRLLNKRRASVKELKEDFKRMFLTTGNWQGTVEELEARMQKVDWEKVYNNMGDKEIKQLFDILYWHNNNNQRKE